MALVLSQVFDAGSGELTSTIEAHSGAIWSIASRPDGKGVTTGSADHDVKFWEFEMVEEPESNKRFAGLFLLITLALPLFLFRSLSLSLSVLWSLSFYHFSLLFVLPFSH